MNRMKKIAAGLLALLLLLSCAACQTSGNEPTESADQTENDIYRFENYQNSEVFDIVKVAVSGNLAQKCSTYKFTYLSDGLKIKAYISIPTSMEATQKPGKCILYNRGGNRDFGKLDNDATANICAVSDRIVIASQYRGADGSQGFDQFGGDDLHDVIKLIDLCEKHFSFVDMDDFCVAGISRGGLMTYMAARQDKRIKRIIAVSAPCNLTEEYELRDDMKQILIETIGSTPQEDPEAYERRSAICWYDELKLPVLIIHSKNDAQVSYSQAEALSEKLKETTDCTFISYDDDVHGIHPEDYAIIRKWLDQ